MTVLCGRYVHRGRIDREVLRIGDAAVIALVAAAHAHAASGRCAMGIEVGAKHIEIVTGQRDVAALSRGATGLQRA